MKVYIGRKDNFQFEVTADWKKYQLLVFNIIQNAVKYNSYAGQILILFSCEKYQSIFNQGEEQEDIYEFETEIIDTGIGITEQRQKMLFVPFLELKVK